MIYISEQEQADQTNLKKAIIYSTIISISIIFHLFSWIILLSFIIPNGTYIKINKNTIKLFKPAQLI